MFVLRSVLFQKRSQVVGWAALLIGSLLAASSAFAQVPTAADPTSVWKDDFSNGSPTTPRDLEQYTGVGSITYTADLDWLPGEAGCNGWILNSTTPLPTVANAGRTDAGCSGNGGSIFYNGSVRTATTPTPWVYLRRMAYYLGVAQTAAGFATDPTTNNALASMSNAGKNQPDHIQFETGSTQTPAETIHTTPPVVAGHFYIVSAWFAEVHCRSENSAWYNANETVNLLAGGVTTTLANGFTPCVAPSAYMNEHYTYTDSNGNSANSAGTIHVAHLQSSGWLATGSNIPIGIQILNQTINYVGNDLAIDTPELLDATPTLYKSFSSDPTNSTDTTVGPGGTATLTFIIVNTTDKQAKTGWSFDDELNGVTYVSSTTTCGTGTLVTSATSAGVDTIHVVGGNLPAGSATCSISVKVTAPSTMGAYDNDPGTNLKNLVGLVNPNKATLNVATLILEKTAKVYTDISLANEIPAVLQDGNIIVYTFTVTNPSSTDSVSDFTVTDDTSLFTGLGNPIALNCSTLTVGGSSTTTLGPGVTGFCTGTYEVVSADLANDSILNTATVDSANPPDQSPPSSWTVPIAKPALTVTKTADTNELIAGATITFTFKIQNTGNISMDDVTLTADSSATGFTGTGTLTLDPCAPETLDVGDSMTCTASYVVTSADVTAGVLLNKATAGGDITGTSAKILFSSTSNLLSLRNTSSATVPTLDARMLALLALMLGGLAAWSARRRVWK